MQEGIQEVPSPARAGPRAARSPFPLAVWPPHSAPPSPDGRARGTPGPGERGRRVEDRAAQGALTSTLPAAAGAGPGGARARPAHPPAVRLSRAPGSPALRPRVPKLLNLRAAHALPGQRPTRRIGPLGRRGSVRPSLSAVSLLAVRSRLSSRCACFPSRLRSAGAPSRERSQSSARTREGIPPFAVPPPSRPPFPGSTAKNGLERQARESVAPSRTPLPAAGALRWERRAGSRTCALDPGADPQPLFFSSPRPASRGFHAARADAAAPGILRSKQGGGASGNLSFPIRIPENDTEQAQPGLLSWPRPPPLRVKSEHLPSSEKT